MQDKMTTKDFDYLAPDTSEIRLLASSNNGGLCHCKLNPEQISQAVKHKTVTEIWYILKGEGKLWRSNEEKEKVTALEEGLSISIEPETSFQFRNTSSTVALEILIVTMPPWPGDDEAVETQGIW